ncbi:MAG TPA: DUF4397 domain-containing protein [Flavisolibacter sp.]
MKKIFAFAAISSALFISCKKDLEQPADWSSVAVIHTSPVSSASPDTLHVFFNDLRSNSNGILYNNNSTYLPVLAGPKTVGIRRGATTASSSYINSFEYSFEKGKSYSLFVYDTTTSATGLAKLLRLKDDLTLPAVNMSHIRLLHLAPNASAVDVTLVRTSVTPNDSITIANRSYVGASPNEEALSVFTAVPRGTYTAKVKTAGTQNVLTSSTVTLTTGASVSEGRIVTVYVTGTAKGRPLAIGTFRHY